MTTTLLIIGAFVVAFIVFARYNLKKMKNLPLAADSDKIKTLTGKNFKTQIKSGIVLVDFWAPWCGPCKMMAPVLNDLAESVGDSVTIAKVNVDQQQALAQEYKIRSIPTLVMFQNGKPVNRFSGIKSKSFLMKQLDDVMSV